MKFTDLTLIIPAKKEQDSLPIVIKELDHLNLIKMVVLEKDDTETIESIKDLNCNILFQSNKGYGDALINGINHTKTKYFCIFNADGSFDPKEISDMFSIIQQDSIDFVFGSRYLKSASSDDDTLITYVGNKFFSFLGKLLFKLPINDILYTFVMGDTTKTKKLNLSQKDFSFCVELPIKAHKANCKLTSNIAHERSRIAGVKKVNAFKDGFLILCQMIRLFFKNN